MYDAARVPSPKDGANGMAQAAVPGAGAGTAAGSAGLTPTALLQAKAEGGQPEAEPVLLKKPHREILDHERKRRVELKCMELQEMMEEQGYTEEEIRQKVSTFRQMLMDKEGVITREGSHTQPAEHPPTKENHSVAEQARWENRTLGLANSRGRRFCSTKSFHPNRRTLKRLQLPAFPPPSRCGAINPVKRKSSSSPSPRPKKRKKKKSGHRRSRFGSSSPAHREKKKKSGKKHKRDREGKKRRHRSGSSKNKHKDKNKQKKRSPGETP
uniref:CWF21 domain-containing protein n=1 Tax=Gasterosteus aculeatus TaxID=69293 RepID=G3QA15_GASAC